MLHRLAPTLNLANVAMLLPLAGLFPALRRALMHDSLSGCRSAFPHSHPQRCLMVMWGANHMTQLFWRAKTVAATAESAQPREAQTAASSDLESLTPPSLLAGATHFVTWVDDKTLESMPSQERSSFDAAWQGLMQCCHAATDAYEAGAEHPMTLSNQQTMQYTGSEFWLTVRAESVL